MKRLFISLLSLLTLFSCDWCFLQSNSVVADIEVVYDERVHNDRPSGGFISDITITHDDDYFYAISYGKPEDPGLLIRVSKIDGTSLEIPIQPTAVAAGFVGSRSFNPCQILLSGSDLLITTIPDVVSVDFEVLCFNKDTMILKWLWASNDSDDLRWFTTPVYWNGSVVLAAVEYGVTTHLTFLDCTTGMVQVEREIPESSLTTIIEPLLNGNNLYLRTSGRPLVIYDLTLAFDTDLPIEQARIFSVNTTTQLGDSTDSAIITDGERYYVSCDFDLQARLLASNELVWKNPLERSLDGIWAPFTLYDGTLLVPADYGCIYRIEAVTGSTLWKKEIRPSTNSYLNLYAQGFVVQDRWYVQPSHSTSELVILSLDHGCIVARIPCWVSTCNRNGFVEGDDIYMTTDFQIIKVHLREK